MRNLIPLLLRSLLPLLVWLPGQIAASELVPDKRFTIAVIPDTQNYLDYRHQREQGYLFDAAELFLTQMRFVAANAVANGGDIAFVASVGDVWQHQSVAIDAEHERRGMAIEANPLLARNAVRRTEVLTIEMPKAVEGYRIISAAGLPFGVAPGNHDYDAAWSVAGYPPRRGKAWSELSRTVADMGILHVGGLDNFRSVFGAESEFFRGRPWYVASFRGGANSAQRFRAGGYTFLHFALEMQADDEVIRWVESVLAEYPGEPAILTTHDYLSTQGERLPNPVVDLARVEPEHHNSAEQLWQKLISRQDQIFMVLCGHQHGQSIRVENNRAGNPVYQILADYQDRGQAALDAGSAKSRATGDGWLRLMRFDFSARPATLSVKTYSSHYQHYSSNLDSYALWYRENEQPQMSDTQFLAADEFVLELNGFERRFGSARQDTAP